MCLSAGAQVPARDARNADIINTDTHLPLPQFTSLKLWEERKAFLRNQVLVSAGLSPMPEKTPLHPQVFGLIEARDYTIQKVLIEPLPGFYLGGNLYRPRNGKVKHPGVLNPQGHWPYGRLENQPLYSGPSLGISLARQGYVVFAYDMVGYNDTLQVPHRFGNAEERLWSFGPLGLQLWDSIRALDFLASLNDVDANDLGVTGASGGGTQTFLLTAVDDRVQFASPVNMVSAIMQGGDLCENAPGLRVGTSNVEIAAMFAPRPMLVVSATGDWTHNVPREEYPAIKRIYDLYGKGDQVDVVQIDEQHNYNRLSREAVYAFFAKHHPGLTESRELKEHDIEVPMVQQMTVLSNRKLPDDALGLEGLFSQWIRMAQVQNEQTHDHAFLRDRLRQTLGVETPGDVIAETNGRSIVLSRQSKRDRVPGLWVDGKKKSMPVAIVVESDGSTSSQTVTRLENEGRTVLAINAFQTGAIKARREGDTASGWVPAKDDADEEARADAVGGYGKFLTFNPSIDGARVQDILTAIAYANRSGRGVEIYASGDAALWATFATAVSDIPVSLHVTDIPEVNSNADYLQHFNVPGIRRAGGLAAARELAATH
jgi:hypothetical protein